MVKSMGAQQQAYAENIQPAIPAAVIARQFIAALESADHPTWPYDYWLLEKALPDPICEVLTNMELPVPKGMDFGGRRECNNARRVYFDPDWQAESPTCKAIADAFKQPSLTRAIEQATGTDLAGTSLRIEYCQDTDGFWLEPHVDISVKRFSMSIYLTDELELAHAGTDIYDDTPEHKRVATAPYGKGKAMVFIPSTNTWHGFSKRPMNGIRKNLIVNYVTNDWRATEELA
jgi:hypothetical protein